MVESNTKCHLKNYDQSHTQRANLMSAAAPPLLRLFVGSNYHYGHECIGSPPSTEITVYNSGYENVTGLK